jgi:DNA-binding GntR family transcriptional regulator
LDNVNALPLAVREKWPQGSRPGLWLTKPNQPYTDVCTIQNSSFGTRQGPTMPSRPSRLTSLGHDALAKIRGALMEGSLAPGQRIRETDLAERFSMSRTPVREAIHVMRAKGLVSHQDGVLVITRLDRRLLDEIYAMRETLEGMSARLAARGAKPEDVEDLKAILAREVNASSPQQRVMINVKFHSLLAVLADNRYLSSAIEDLSDTLTLLGPTTLADDARFAQAHQEHLSIVDAIAKGDGEAAEARMRAHVRAAWQVRRVMMLREADLEPAGINVGNGQRKKR